MSVYQRISSGEGNSVQDLGCEDVTARGFRTNSFKHAVYLLCNVIFCFIPWLLCRWYSDWWMSLNCDSSSLVQANRVLITDENGEKTICKVIITTVDFLPDEFATSTSSGSNRRLQRQDSRTPLFDAESSGSAFRYFTFRNDKYFWDEHHDCFTKIEGLVGLTCEQMLNEYRGMCPNRRIQLRAIYGVNEIFVEVKSYFTLLVDEVLNPYYLFQVVSVVLWCFDEYYLYAICVIVISGSSILISLYKTRKQNVTLRDMARGSGDFNVNVQKSTGDEDEISCRDLVPGDILLIPPEGCIMPCDAVVIQGNCIVNESMLTGESVPVNKSSLLPSTEVFNCESHKRHVIFCGTEVIQPRFYAGNKVACVVVRTGCATLKGQLIRSIMFPKEVDFKFYSDSMKFVFLLFCVALIGMIYSIYVYVQRGTGWFTTLVRVLDIVTIVVPPALPAAMTIGTLNAQARLKKNKIFCISPQRINFCGKLKLICFDKTGTLTEDGLNLSCVVPSVINAGNNEDFLEPISDPQELEMTSPLLRGMAVCHSLTHIKGKIVGDPLDLKMFESTGWILEEPPLQGGNDSARYDLLPPTVIKKDDTQIGVIREFDFTPQLQRMSVVVNSLELPCPQMAAYVKGAPEKIRPLCVTVPEKFDKVLDWFTVKGFRVLALAWKKVEGYKWHEIQKISREKIESDLQFAGFLIMQNSLKPATVPVIRDLNGANVRSVMVTGDNLLTALSVARECGMIPSQDKVVIVNALDDGTLEYTLASQHYEPNDEEVDLNTNSGASNNNEANDREISFAPDEDASPTTASALGRSIRRLSKRFSFDANAPDTIIDMERLLPIELLKGSNYHFALTGKTWTFLQQSCCEDELRRIISKGSVFARMSPECKMQLVQSLQDIGYVVAMCGDGANDCSALSVAHVGISLSEAEASVAAPFTSKIADISCVPKLILEGRCALVTSFSIFKYMALYSMVQFASVLILYTHYTNLADAQFLWIDLAITWTITVAMGRTQPVRRLVAKRPMSSLISFSNIFSIFSQILICVLLQYGAMLLLESQNWFVPIKPSSTEDKNPLCWETTTIFSTSAFQYLIISVVFSTGKPFRKPFYLNYAYLLAILILTGCTSILVVYPVPVLARFFELEPLSNETQNFRFLLLAFPVVNFLSSGFIENFVAGSKLIKKIGKKVWKKGPKSAYKQILEEVKEDQTWPPITNILS